jgi:hypothetical protein
MAAMTDAELSGLLKANNRFNEDLRKYQKGTLPRWKILDAGLPLGELSKHLDKAQNILLPQRILTKAQKGHESTIALEQLKDLPIKLNQAPLIFQSKKTDSVVVVINERDNKNNPVVIPINKKGAIADGGVSKRANLITSIYGRPQKHFDLWTENGLSLYKGDKEKTFTHPEQPGTIPGVEVNKGFKDATNVAQNNESTNSLAEKMADLTKKNTALLRKSSNSNPHKSPGRGR